VPQPQRATTLLKSFLPAKFEFYRAPIAAPPPQVKKSPSLPASARISEAARAATKVETSSKTAIHGSVTTADIAENLKELLTASAEASRIVLWAEEIAFVDQGEEKDRVKHLGEFNVEIKLKGADEGLRRTVTVKALE